jgi:hypothetical protein
MSAFGNNVIFHCNGNGLHTDPGAESARQRPDGTFMIDSNGSGMASQARPTALDVHRATTGMRHE